MYIYIYTGIEYGDMQLIAEIYDVLKTLAQLNNEELSETFIDWNEGELESFLIEITSHITNHKDDQGKPGYLLDKILDKTGVIVSFVFVFYCTLPLVLFSSLLFLC